MYIPIMKTREEELKVSAELNYCYSNEIIPLFEIINEIYEKKYKLDDNGNKLMELKVGNKRKTPVLKDKTAEDIITLDKINTVVNGAKVFIDYFRFDVAKYGKNLDVRRIMLAYSLNSNSEQYIMKLKEISNYENMIPVLSLKKGFTFSNSKTIEIIQELQSFNTSIAFRIEDQLYDNYKDIIEKYLRESDYLLYDINEQNFWSKVIELEELEDCKTKARIILLNSPRQIKYANKDFENCCVTSLIDNSMADGYDRFNVDGFGDYGGLKDQLPTKNSGNNGKGAALALLYNYKDNSFYSFCNSDTSLGLKGYHDVVNSIISYESILNPDNNCAAYTKIRSMIKRKGYGTWATWNNIALTRYIHQIYLKTNK